MQPGAGGETPARPPAGLETVTGFMKGRNALNSHQGRVKKLEQRASSRKCTEHIQSEKGTPWSQRRPPSPVAPGSPGDASAEGSQEGR